MNFTPKKSRWEKQHQHIQRVAYELYQNRILLGRKGNEHADWVTAQRIVQSPWKTLLFASNRPLIKLEKQLAEPFSNYLKRWSVFDIVDRLSPALEAIGVLLIPLVLYLASQAYENQREAQENERLQQETVQNYFGQLSEILLNVNGDLSSEENQRIWGVLTASTTTLLQDPNLDEHRKGQILAFLGHMGLLEGSAPTDLNSNKQPIISLNGAQLEGVNLAFAQLRGAYLKGVSFKEANLRYADLSWSDLHRADFRQADLSEANLRSAKPFQSNFDNANLSKAQLFGVLFSGSELRFARFDNADLRLAFLTGADLRNSTFIEANLSQASVTHADLRNTNFHRATLNEAVLEEAKLYRADFRQARLNNV
ncbi:MAG: pentapeptide repeat-containing protein [Cyanobacteria bacterium P01_H01_bin.21]